MAFSLRRMLSNITYFTKSEDGDSSELGSSVFPDNMHDKDLSFPPLDALEFDNVQADSSRNFVPESVKKFAAKKAFLSDSNINTSTQDRKVCRKLTLDVNKASQSLNDSTNSEENLNIENTPKHKLLDCKDTDLFKNFNFNQSFDISDAVSIASSEDVDIESLSDHSDTDVSTEANGVDDIKMCRKVESRLNEALPSKTPESFGDVEIDQNEQDRITLLLNYQMKLEKVECMLKKLLSEFQFHIEVSKIFNCKSVVTTLPGTDMTNIPKTLGNVTYIDNIQHGVSPIGWNIIMEKEDYDTKTKLKNQLQTMKSAIDNFIHSYLQEKPKLTKSKTFDLHKGNRFHKQNPVSQKKKLKYYDYPDLREAMVNLFTEDDINQNDCCSCHCHFAESSMIKSDKEINHSISSSIGNFTVDSTTLSAYSESLDQIISYNSFNDSTLFNTLLQKPAIERITFYIQVHSIQLQSNPSEEEFESKNNITFYCSTCKSTVYDENSLLNHIFSSSHCEKIHFVYKTAYVKKCFSAGKEIQPSTILNPMTMYRDDNKIVCFGDSSYACSLCFVTLIVGESILMSHCTEEEHVSRRDMLNDIYI